MAPHASAKLNKRPPRTDRKHNNIRATRATNTHSHTHTPRHTPTHTGIATHTYRHTCVFASKSYVVYSTLPSFMGRLFSLPFSPFSVWFFPFSSFFFLFWLALNLMENLLTTCRLVVWLGLGLLPHSPSLPCPYCCLSFALLLLYRVCKSFRIRVLWTCPCPALLPGLNS